MHIVEPGEGRIYNGFARRHTVITQDEIRRKAREDVDEARFETAVIRGEVEVGDGVLDTRFLEFVEENRSTMRGVERDLDSRLSNRCRKGRSHMSRRSAKRRAGSEEGGNARGKRAILALELLSTEE